MPAEPAKGSWSYAPALMELQVRTEKVVGFSSACVMNQPLKYSACVPAQMGRAVRTQPCTAALRVTAKCADPGAWC